MIEHAKVRFTNGNVVDVERVKFKPGGWIGVRCDGGEWVYYPDRHIARVVSR
jgi:hypothetical protein